MSGNFTLKKIAVIHTDFKEKFGVPRQSGLVPELEAQIVFEREFRDANAFRGLEGYSHIWIIWQFSEVENDGWSPTVRPPRLGGNERMGVFATRSPFRPNALGLSSVKLEKIDYGSNGPILTVSGADLKDGTPIYDIKPYLPYTDSHPEAKGGFADGVAGDKLTVLFPGNLSDKLPFEKRAALTAVLKSDPRPSYQNNPQRIYGFTYAGFEIRFTVDGNILTVCNVEKICQ